MAFLDVVHHTTRRCICGPLPLQLEHNHATAGVQARTDEGEEVQQGGRGDGWVTLPDDIYIYIYAAAKGAVRGRGRRQTRSAAG